MDRALGDFLAENGLSGTPDTSAIHDKGKVRALLIEAARDGRAHVGLLQLDAAAQLPQPCVLGDERD